MIVTQKEIVEALRTVAAIIGNAHYANLANAIEVHGIAPPDYAQTIEQIMRDYPCNWDDTAYLLRCAERYGNVTEPTHLHLLAVALANTLKDEILARQTLPAVLKKVHEGIAPPECDDCGELMSERDNAEDTLDAVLDLVLGKDRREWSNLYGFIEAIEDVEGRMVELSAPIFAPPEGYAIVPIITESTPFSCGINGDPPQVDNAWTPPCKVWCGRKQCAAKEST